MKKSLFLLLLLVLTVCSCSAPEPKITHGTKAEDINGFLHLEKYPPIKVEYELTIYGEAIIELGPKDYYLDAILYYDPETLMKLRNMYPPSNYEVPSTSSDRFNFHWLPEEIKRERLETMTGYSNHHGDLSANPNIELWFLKDKVLVHYFTN